MKASQLKGLVKSVLVFDYGAPQNFIQGHVYETQTQPATGQPYVSEYWECLVSCSQNLPTEGTNFVKLDFSGWQKEDGSFLES